MSKIGEMRKIDLALDGLSKSGYKKMGLNGRAAVYESVLELSAQVNKLMTEDPAIRTYGERVLKKAKIIEDDMDVPMDAPPPPAPGGGEGGGDDAPPAEPEVEQEAFTKVITKVLKDLCPECDDLKIGEAATGLFNKFVENEPLGINACVEMLRETADKGGDIPPGEGDAPPAAPAPANAAPADVIESAMAIISALAKGDSSKGSAKDAEAKLKEAQTELATTKERLTRNLQLLKEAADHIETVDAKLKETEETLNAAVTLLKESNVANADVLLEKFKKKGDKADPKAADADPKAGADDKKDEKKDDKKDEKTDESKSAPKADAPKADEAKLKEEADAKAAKEKAEADAKLTETKVKEEFGKMNDGKKTVKEIEEAMNAMFKDTDWKKMVNFEEASKAIEAKLTESKKADEPHDFVRQMGRLRTGAYNQLSSNSVKK